MRKAIGIILAVLAASAGAQTGLRGSPKILSVCEVLGAYRRYAGNAVAIVGRLESSVSLTDHYEYLSQDGCRRAIVTHGHKWSNEIQLWGWDEGMPRPPREHAKFDPTALAAKLALVRRTTMLGVHKEPRLQVQAHHSSEEVDVPNEWVVAYGRIVLLPRLEDNCGVDGCGGDNVPLLLLVEEYNLHVLGEDGGLQPTSRLPFGDAGRH